MRPSNVVSDQSIPHLVELLRLLAEGGYEFTTVTPASHTRVLARRPGATANDPRDVLGWSLRFERDLLPPDVFEALQAAGALDENGGLYKSRLRVSALQGRLFLHSAYPTDSDQAVFFGPDSYRFADFIRAELMSHAAAGALLDIGAGSGVGAIVAAGLMRADRIVITDINPDTAPLAAANVAHAGIEIEHHLTPDAETIDGAFDIIVANPPFIVDDQRRAYRHGGGEHGGQLTLDWAAQALGKLAPGGRLLLYSGSAIVGGEDRLRTRLQGLARRQGFRLSYREIDPDIFGEELSRPAYAEVERIAAIGAVLTRPG